MKIQDQLNGSNYSRSALGKLISLFFVGFGILIRLIQYLYNRSLWTDEASIALNIINRSYLNLLDSLDYNQAAPPGFLWLEKLSVQILGDSEYALRLFPFVASILGILAFYRLAIQYTSAVAAPIAIALFACLRYSVYYATEVKQYSSDMMVTLLLCLVLLPRRYQFLKAREILWLSLVGSVAIWLSHPAIFVLAGIELGFLFSARTHRNKLFWNRLPIYLCWLLSFSLLYWLTITGTMANEILTDSWENRFPDSPFDVIWLFDAWGRFFYRPLGFFGITDGVAIVAFICGCIAYFRQNKTILIAFTAPIIATLIASYLHKYPFRERLVLFLMPFALLIIAEGIGWLLSQRRSQLISLLGIAILVALLGLPFSRASALLINPERAEEIKTIIEYVKSQQQPGDSLYIAQSGANLWKYYGKKYGYEDKDYFLSENILPEGGVAAIAELPQLTSEIDRFRGQKRVWFLFVGKEPKENPLLPYLNSIGHPIDVFRQPGAFVYLYDLTKTEQR